MNQNRCYRRLLISAAAVALCTAAVFAAPVDIQRHWSGTAVNTLIENGALTGYPDGRFRPDHSISREEAAVIFSSLIRSTAPQGLPPGAGEVADPGTQPEAGEAADGAGGAAQGAAPVFSDIADGHWSGKQVGELAALHMISGYPDGTFRPAALITREEFAAVLYQYVEKMNGSLGGPETVGGFSDTGNSFALKQIQVLADRQILKGGTDGRFRPQDPITRGEAAAALYAASGLEARPPAVEIPDKWVIEVPYISQVYPVRALVGCEGTSLLTGLKGKGYAAEIDLRQFLDAMPKTTSNPSRGFVGSPYRPDPTKATRTTIYPAKLAEFGNNYGTVRDISGSSPKELQAEILSGNPVVAYATMRWEKPYYRTYNIEGQNQKLLSNNHVVLVCGYDSSTGYYYISDPYNISDPSKELKYWIDGPTFERIYKERRQAVVVE